MSRPSWWLRLAGNVDLRGSDCGHSYSWYFFNVLGKADGEESCLVFSADGGFKASRTSKFSPAGPRGVLRSSAMLLLIVNGSYSATSGGLVELTVEVGCVDACRVLACHGM